MIQITSRATIRARSTTSRVIGQVREDRLNIYRRSVSRRILSAYNVLCRDASFQCFTGVVATFRNERDGDSTSAFDSSPPLQGGAGGGGANFQFRISDFGFAT